MNKLPNTLGYEVVKDHPKDVLYITNKVGYKDGQCFPIYESEKIYTYGCYIGRWSVIYDPIKNKIIADIPPLMTPTTEGFTTIRPADIVSMTEKINSYKSYENKYLMNKTVEPDMSE